MIDRQRVRRAFDRAAGDYDRVAGLQREMAERLLSRLDYIRIEPKTIVDVGCGTGQLAGQLARNYRPARVMALDFAESMLRQARKRGSWRRPVRCICGTAERLPLQAQSVDLLISNAMLQWCDEPKQVFDEWLRVLRPGGLLLFTTFGAGTLAELVGSWARVDDYPHVSHFADMHELGDALLGSGWQDPVMDVDRFTFDYPDVAELMRDIKALGAANALSGRRKQLTGKGKLVALRDAYEAYRRPTGLPASYEAVFGLAWAPTQRRVGEVTRVSLEGLTGLGNRDGR